MTIQQNDSFSSNLPNIIKKEVHYRRIHSIDFLKGLSICIIILINTAHFWIEDNSRYYYALIYLYMDVLGTSLFIFLFTLSTIFLWKKKMGINPSKEIRNDILIRGILLICAGLLYNFILSSIFSEVYFPFNLWGWNLLVFIGFAQIISYYAVRLSRGARWIFGFIIFFITTPIREYLMITRTKNLLYSILHFIIVSPNPEVTILPYIAICFFSTIFGERILECLQLNEKQCDLETFRSSLIIGVLFILIGLYYGAGLVNSEILYPEDYPMINLIPIIQENVSYAISGVPGYLIRGTAPNMLYGFGVSLCILSIMFYLLDIRQIHNILVKVLSFFGNSSLNLVIIHYIGFLFFSYKLNLIMFFIIYFIYLLVLGFIMLIWNKYANNIGTLKWLMAKLGSRHK